MCLCVACLVILDMLPPAGLFRECGPEGQAGGCAKRLLESDEGVKSREQSVTGNRRANTD